MAGVEKYRGRKKNVPQVLDEQSSIKQLATAERSVVDAVDGRLVSGGILPADTLGRRGQAVVRNQAGRGERQAADNG